MSERRRAIIPGRRAFREWMLAAHPRCQAGLPGCSGKAVDVHEPKTRGRGGSIVDPANGLCLCRWCHDAITTATGELLALCYERGWLKHSWDD